MREKNDTERRNLRTALNGNTHSLPSPSKKRKSSAQVTPSVSASEEPVGEVILKGQMELHEKHSVRCGLAPSASVQDKFTPPLQAEVHTNLPEEVIKAAPWCRNTSVAQM